MESKKSKRAVGELELNSVDQEARIGSFQANLDVLQKMRDEARQGGGLQRIEVQHTRGKLTARERIDLLLDEGSFEEYDMLKTGRGGPPEGGKDYLSDGVVTGHGTIDGREVFVSSQDFILKLSQWGHFKHYVTFSSLQ